MASRNKEQTYSYGGQLYGPTFASEGRSVEDLDAIAPLGNAKAGTPRNDPGLRAEVPPAVDNPSKSGNVDPNGAVTPGEGLQQQGTDTVPGNRDAGLDGLDFASDEAAEFASREGLPATAFGTLKPSGKGGYTVEDVRQAVKLRDEGQQDGGAEE